MNEPSLIYTDGNYEICRYCRRAILHDRQDGWVDPEATGDDSIWREYCDSNDTERAAPHEPERYDWAVIDRPNGGVVDRFTTEQSATEYIAELTEPSDYYVQLSPFTA